MWRVALTKFAIAIFFFAMHVRFMLLVDEPVRRLADPEWALSVPYWYRYDTTTPHHPIKNNGQSTTVLDGSLEFFYSILHLPSVIVWHFLLPLHRFIPDSMNLSHHFTRTSINLISQSVVFLLWSDQAEIQVLRSLAID